MILLRLNVTKLLIYKSLIVSKLLTYQNLDLLGSKITCSEASFIERSFLYYISLRLVFKWNK